MLSGALQRRAGKRRTQIVRRKPSDQLEHSACGTVATCNSASLPVNRQVAVLGTLAMALAAAYERFHLFLMIWTWIPAPWQNLICVVVGGVLLPLVPRFLRRVHSESRMPSGDSGWKLLSNQLTSTGDCRAIHLLLAGRLSLNRRLSLHLARRTSERLAPAARR